jgi:pimeloyl-ACP methyl ester carboxylesterase
MNGKFQQEWIHHIKEGEGPPVILVHGIAASLSDWDALMPELVRAGFSVYALDLLGHGDSLKPRERRFYHAQMVYAVFEAWLQSLQLERPPILIGHSLGGYLGLQYSLLHPQGLRGLVLIDPFYSQKQITPLLRRLNRYPQWGEKVLSLVPEWLLNLVMGLDPTNRSHFDPQSHQRIANDYKRASPRILYIPATTADLTSRLGEVQTASLVIWGERDLTLSPPSFKILLQNLPNASGRGLPGCGHQPHIGKPEEVNRMILQFIEGLRQGKAAGSDH